MIGPSTIQVEIRKGKAKNIKETRGTAMRDGLFTGVASGIRSTIKRMIKGEMSKDVNGTITVIVCPDPR